MDGKLVSGSLSAPEGSERDSSLPSITYTERFYEQFPYYLAIGMTPEQYWDGDPAWAKYYRQADELKLERLNQQLWLQGMYVYEAICDASPILRAFAKKGTKPHPFTEKPYPLTAKQRINDAADKEKAVAEKGKRMMEAFMKLNNSKFGNVAQE